MGWNASLTAIAVIASLTGSSDEGSSSVELSFPFPVSRVEVGQTQVLSFETADLAESDLTWSAVVEPAGLLSIAAEPQLLAGHRVGFLRVRGLAAGEARLSIGDRSMRVEVRDRASRTEVDAPRVVSPAPNAVVWGTIAVGVEYLRRDHGPVDEVELRLELPTGRRLQPTVIEPSSYGPTVRVSFEVDVDRFAEGEARLVPVLQGAVERRGEAVSVHVIRSSDERMHQGECEDWLESASDARAGPLRLGSSPEASGGQGVFLVRGDPVWSTSVDVKRPGRYQMIVVARGDFLAGAFPSVGLCTDDVIQPVTMTRVTSHRWQRIAVGRPVTLGDGEQTLSLRLVNPLGLGGDRVRGLYLDRFELLEIPDVIQGAPGGPMMGVMAGGGAPGRSSDGLWIAFERPLDRRIVTGTMHIDGVCRWVGSDEAPYVELRVNGELGGVQQTALPRFRFDGGALREGPNTIQLIAELPDGRRRATPVQTVEVPAGLQRLPPRRFHRFAVQDQRWGSSLRDALSDEQQPPSQRIGRLRPGAELKIELPASLEGRFETRLEARAPTHAGAVSSGRSRPKRRRYPWARAWRKVGGVRIQVPLSN